MLKKILALASLLLFLFAGSALAQSGDAETGEEPQSQDPVAVGNEDSQVSDTDYRSGDHLSGPSSVTGQAAQDARDRERTEGDVPALDPRLASQMDELSRCRQRR